MTSASESMQRTAREGFFAPRPAAFKGGPRRRRSAATKYLITFPYRLMSHKPAPTAERESFQESGLGAERPQSAPGLTIVGTRASPACERELITLDVACTNHAPGLVRAALSEIRELDGVRDDVILVASELVANAVMHSGGSAGDMIHVRAACAEGTVLISVDDPELSYTTPRCATRMSYTPAGMGCGL